jgi:hypothetical protein
MRSATEKHELLTEKEITDLLLDEGFQLPHENHGEVQPTQLAASFEGKARWVRWVIVLAFLSVISAGMSG